MSCTKNSDSNSLLLTIIYDLYLILVIGVYIFSETSNAKIQFSDVFCIKIVELCTSALNRLDSGKVLIKIYIYLLSGIFCVP